MTREKSLLVLAFGLILFLEISNIYINNKRMNSSKKELKERGEEMISLIENGEADALPELIEVRKQIEFLKSYEESLKPHAIRERELYPEKALIMHGVNIQLGNTGDRLDYEKDAEYKKIKDTLKEREKDLKDAYKSDHIIVDCEGVVIPKVPVKSHGKTIIKLSF